VPRSHGLDAQALGRERDLGDRKAFLEGMKRGNLPEP
jgi:hypothetical protein